ncbi:hypothetical protein [Frankia gtarii]|nr:hypothetical protein [Frankia gtarii]
MAGHPDSRAGTVGDAVLLPTLAAVLVAGNSAMAAHARSHEREGGEISPLRLSLPIAVVAGSIGLAVQYAWWVDPHATPQWGRPTPRHFSVAGWWHAAFFVAACAAFAGQYASLLVRLRIAIRAGDEPFVTRASRRACSAGIWAFTSFVALVLQDSAPTVGRGSAIATIATAAATLAATGAAGTALVWAAGPARSQHLPRPLTVGLVGAVGLAAACHRWPP